MLKNYKNFIFSLIIFLFFVIIFEIGVRILIQFKKQHLFQKEQSLNFYKNYTNSLNHMRDASNNPDKAYNYLFNYLHKTSDEKNKYNTILLQGDSQTESLNSLNKNNLKEIIKGKTNIINAGTTSFSPSLMSVQFDILVKDFKIKPNIVIAIIDSTDIGDENCRYKELIEIKYNKITKVQKVKNRGEFYFYENNFLFSEIYLSKFPKVIFIPKIIKHFIKYNLNTVSKCKFNIIQNYLIEKKNSEQEYFKFILEKYISNVTSYDFVEKIYIVSFPHIQHFDKKYHGIKYNVNVGDLISSIEFNNYKVTHLNFFEENIFQKYKSNLFEIYLKDDPASHFTRKGLIIFFREIMDKIQL